MVQKNHSNFDRSVSKTRDNLGEAVSTQFLTELFDQFSEAVIVANTNREMVYVNAQAESLFGYAEEELLGLQTKKLYANATDFSEQGKKRFNQDNNQAPESYRVPYQRADGDIFLGLTTGSVMRNSQGDVVGYMGIVRPARTADQSLDTLQKILAISSDYSLAYSKKVELLLKAGLQHFGLEIAIQSHIEGNNYLVEHCVDNLQKLKPSSVFNVSGTYCTHTLAAKQPIGFHFAGQSRIQNHPCYKDFKLESYIGSPISIDGHVYGTVNFSGYSPTEPFCEDDYTMIKLLADTLSHMIYKKQSEESLQELARTDALTSLPNRRAILEVLANNTHLTLRNNISLSILSIDLDHFKQINDNWGHSAGDLALQVFADLCRTMGRKTDECGRLGGEEFIMILPNANAQVAQQIGHELRQCLQEHPIELADKAVITLTVSVGVASLKTNESSEELLARADAAMYKAKHNGRDQVCMSAN